MNALLLQDAICQPLWKITPHFTQASFWIFVYLYLLHINTIHQIWEKGWVNGQSVLIFLCRHERHIYIVVYECKLCKVYGRHLKYHTYFCTFIVALWWPWMRYYVPEMASGIPSSLYDSPPTPHSNEINLNICLTAVYR